MTRPLHEMLTIAHHVLRKFGKDVSQKLENLSRNLLNYLGSNQIKFDFKKKSFSKQFER